MNLPITSRQKQMLSVIYKYIKNTGYPPTFEEMRERLGVKSNQSVIDLLGKLEKNSFLKRNQSGARSIAILPLGYQILEEKPLLPFLGVTHAGLPMSMLTIDGEWEQMPGEVAKFSGDVFLLRVSGDSMINAGIDHGDMILVKNQKEFVSGDIVLAEVDGESMVKRFISEDKPPYLYLRPENPSYPIVFFTEKVTLKAKVISVFKKEQWVSVN